MNEEQILAAISPFPSVSNMLGFCREENLAKLNVFMIDVLNAPGNHDARNEYKWFRGELSSAESAYAALVWNLNGHDPERRIGEAIVGNPNILIRGPYDIRVGDAEESLTSAPGTNTTN
jgi:hypothetical protein